MVTSGIPLDPIAVIYYGLLAGNPLVSIICLIAGPRPWSRRLGEVFLWLNGLVLVCVVVVLANFIFITGLRDEGGFGFGLTLMLAAPLLVEFLILLAIRRTRLRDPAHRP